MKIKRILAYIVDVFIITLISSFLFSTIFKSDYERHYDLGQGYLKEILDRDENSISQDRIVEMNYNLSQLQIKSNIIRFGLTIVYFCFISFAWNGKTIGKKILKIQVVPIKGKKLNPPLFFLREILITNSFFNLLDIINTSVCGLTKWATFTEIISIGKFIAYGLILGFIIFRDDERGLHDVICKTNVVSEKK